MARPSRRPRARTTLLLTAATLVFGIPQAASAEDPPPRMNFAYVDCVPETEATYIGYNSSNWKPGTTATLEYGTSSDSVTVPADGILDHVGLGELFNDVWPTTLRITGTGLDNATYTVESGMLEPECGRRFLLVESVCDPSLGPAIRFETDGWQVVDHFYHVTIAGQRVPSAQPDGFYKNTVWPTTVFIEADLPTFPDLATLESPPLADPGTCPAAGPQALDKVTAGDRSKDAAFGSAVAIDGNYAVVGAPGGGGAYVFRRTASGWVEQTKLIPFDGAGNFFGAAVAIDGTTAVVGAPGSDVDATDGGAAYVFTRSGSTWSEQGRLTPSDPEAGAAFGTAVAVEGDYVVAGAPAMGTSDTGAAYVFFRSGSTWSQQGKLTGSDTADAGRLGHDVALSGTTALVGAPSANISSGAAYVFTRSGSTWTQQAKLEHTSLDDLGYSVAIDGDVAVAGAPGDYEKLKNPGAAYVFTRSGSSWTQGTKWTAGSDGFVGDFFGWSITVAGEVAVVGAPDNLPNSGYAYKFERSGAVWTRTDQIVTFNGPDPAFFGVSVATDGLRIAVGDAVEGPDGEGAANLYAVGPPNTDPPDPPPPPPPPPPDESDPLSCNGIAATINGTADDDVLEGTPGDDVIAGGDGNDTIRGFGGNDLICGGAGDDQLFGGPGNDTLHGGAGADLLRAFTGDDVNYGGGGPDRIQDGPGNDILWGGADKDKMWGGIGVDQLWGEGGNDQLHGNRDDDLLSGGGGTDRIWGDSGVDTLFGDARSDFLYGGIDDDILIGGDGRDRLYGWSGADELYGEAGRDQLRGQDGDDLVNGGSDYDYCSHEPIWIDCEKEI